MADGRLQQKPLNNRLVGAKGDRFVEPVTIARQSHLQDPICGPTDFKSKKTCLEPLLFLFFFFLATSAYMLLN